MQLVTGLIVSYDADRNYYRLRPDLHDIVAARPMQTGADRPYPPSTRVLCARIGLIGWVIIGEVPAPIAAEESERPLTVDETVAKLLNPPTRGEEAVPRYRRGAPVFAGDAVLENRTIDHRERAVVRVFSFGAVLMRATNFCFMMLDPRENQLLMQARSLLQRAVGYLRTVTTRKDDSRTTVREVLQSDYLNTEEDADHRDQAPLVDRELVEGRIPAPNGTTADYDKLWTTPGTERGRRELQGRHRVTEQDFYKQTQRAAWRVVENPGQDDEKAVFEGGLAVGVIDKEGVGTAKRGFRAWLREWFRVEADSEARTLKVEHLPSASTVSITDEFVEMRRGGQVFQLSKDGLFIKAKNIIIEAEDAIVQRSGGEHTVVAPRINHTRG